MSTIGKILFFASSLFIAWTAFNVYLLFKPAEFTKLLPETWWTSKDSENVDTSIRPFKINVPSKVLEDLKLRLNLPFEPTPSLENANFTYGFNSQVIKKVIDFWKNEYDWKQRETFLNQFPQYVTNIQGLDIHFLHVKPNQLVTKDVKVVPLLIMHGWPGSVREFYRLIPLLTVPKDGYVFEIIAPSLPGYGFSEGATKMGLGAAETAVVMKNLMLRLGFRTFIVQGGDWGAVVARNIAAMYPEIVSGLHSNMCFSDSLLAQLLRMVGSVFPNLIVEEKYAHLMYPYWDHFKKLVEELGYLHIQATKPDTVGVALKHSLVGLATYILEKFSTWTDVSWRNLPDGGLTGKYTLTELLDNVMIYWVTGSITTSTRLYSETFRSTQFALHLETVPITVPTACAMFPNELLYTPKSILKHKYANIILNTHMPRGGHFAAFEEPELLANDIFLFVKKLNSI